MNFLKKPAVWVGLMVLVIVGAGGFATWRYMQITKELSRVKGAQAGSSANADEVKRIVAAVSKLMELSSTEEPTVATVTDVEKLRDQPFFARAQNDDKVLIYTSEKRAILYRPSTNKIIDVAPVNLSESTPSATNPQPTAVTKQSPTFAIYNGTTGTGLSRKYETELRTKLPTANVVARENSANQNVNRTVIIDVAGNKTAELRTLAATLGLAVGVLPPGEATPSADFLIIVGSDKAGAELTP